MLGVVFSIFILISFVFITKNFENKEQMNNSENAGRYIPVIGENGSLKKKTKTIKIFDHLELKQGEEKCTETIDVGEYNKIILLHTGPPKEDVPTCQSPGEVCCRLPTALYGQYVLEGKMFRDAGEKYIFEDEIFKDAFDLPALAYSHCDESHASKAFNVVFPKVRFCIRYDYKEGNDPDLTQFPSILRNISSYIFLTQ